MHIAGWKRAHILVGCHCPPEQIETSKIPTDKRPNDSMGHVAHDPEYDGIEPAQPGDVWEIHNTNGGLTGYGLTCPKEDCESGAHFWDHARDCPERYKPDAPPCWTWTGSVEDNTLTATPSLHCVKEWGGCGWHGFLTNGEMVPA